MNRPQAEPLTDRELEVMHAFWSQGEMTAQVARDHLEATGRVLTYTTVANLCRILAEKGFLNRIGETRPFSYSPTKSFQEVSGHLVTDLLHRVFKGSSEQLLLHVLGTTKLSPKKRAKLVQLLQDDERGES
ncbi:MAG: BlaI/MecI/CopY family transcriptional regulator [Pirellula sp.]|jgi:predicted transcriptional regulator|nr:BlaI/MecI/CopY family transcriptional regulator [Pirellula sp.]